MLANPMSVPSVVSTVSSPPHPTVILDSSTLLQQRSSYPTVRMMFPTTIPSQLFGRATLWLPDPIRTARNLAIILTIIEFSIAIVSFPIGFSRLTLGKISDGIEVVLFLTAVIGFWGCTRIKIPLIIMHSIIATGVSVVFLLYLILLISFSSTTDDENRKEDPAIYSAVLSTVFISNISDFLAGLSMNYLLLRLYWYEEEMKKEDTEASQRFEMLLQQQQQQQQQQSTIVTIDTHENITTRNDNNNNEDGNGNPGSHNVPISTTGQQSSTDISIPQIPSAPVLDDYIPSSNVWLDTTVNMNDDVGTSSSSNSSTSSGRSLTTTVIVPAAVSTPSNNGNLTPISSSVSTNVLLCPICMDRPKTTVYYDCGHMACDVCANVMFQQYHKCHLCRKIIKGTVRLYA